MLGRASRYAITYRSIRVPIKSFSDESEANRSQNPLDELPGEPSIEVEALALFFRRILPPGQARLER
jgi:hypothetical protein